MLSNEPANYKRDVGHKSTLSSQSDKERKQRKWSTSSPLTNSDICKCNIGLVIARKYCLLVKKHNVLKYVDKNLILVKQPRFMKQTGIQTVNFLWKVYFLLCKLTVLPMT